MWNLIFVFLPPQIKQYVLLIYANSYAEKDDEHAGFTHHSARRLFKYLVNMSLFHAMDVWGFISIYVIKYSG